MYPIQRQLSTSRLRYKDFLLLPSLPGLTRQSMRHRRLFVTSAWTTGSSPVVTIVARVSKEAALLFCMAGFVPAIQGFLAGFARDWPVLLCSPVTHSLFTHRHPEVRAKRASKGAQPSRSSFEGRFAATSG